MEFKPTSFNETSKAFMQKNDPGILLEEYTVTTKNGHFLICYSKGKKTGEVLSVSIQRGSISEAEKLAIKLRFYASREVREFPLMHSQGFYLVPEPEQKKHAKSLEIVKKIAPTPGQLKDIVEERN